MSTEDRPLTESILMSLMTLVDPLMAEKSSEPCTYTQVKIDDALTDRIRAAVGKLSLALVESGKDRLRIQEYISDLVNADTARILNVKPIKRRHSPPPPKGKGRKSKPAD